MAYAELAGLPPITGLYTSVLCLIAYAIFGPSRVLVLGPGLLARADDRRDRAPARGRQGDPATADRLASMLALLVGRI